MCSLILDLPRSLEAGQVGEGYEVISAVLKEVVD